MRLDDRYGVARLTTDSGIRLLHVRRRSCSVDEGYDGGGTAGVAYRYLGASGRLDLARPGLLRRRRSGSPVGGDRRRVYRYVGTDGVARPELPGLHGRHALGRSSAARPGRVYQYMGEDDTLDLATQNYTDLGLWKPVTDTQLFPQGFNITQSPSATIGATRRPQRRAQRRRSRTSTTRP